MKHGLVLGKIHRVLIADQSDFVRPFIEFNSALRLQAKSQFESELYKLMNNAIYGKTIEDLRKRTKVDIVKDQKSAKRLTSRPQFKGFQILDEDVTVVQSVKSTIVLNKPIACGYMVLENAKNIMHTMWYDVLKPKYGKDIKLLLSDTDSFLYAVFAEDGYRDLYNLRGYMDLSGYEKDTCLGKFYDPTNKKIPGKFSDEKPNEIIAEVVALKPKMYSIKTKILKCRIKSLDHICSADCFVGHTSRAKGITKRAKSQITHEEYKNVLTTCSTTTATVRGLRSYKHRMYSVEIKKRALSAYDNKKYILNDGVNMMSYGHYALKRLG